MTAEIEVRTLFHIKGRGAVVIGHLRQGNARVGQQLQLGAAGASGRTLTIESVEAMRGPDGGSALGLIFKERPTLDQLRGVLPPGSVLRLDDPPGPTP